MPNDLEARFWKLAETQTAGFGFTPVCETLVRNFIRYGVENLMREGLANDEFRIHEAEVNLSRFINTMTQEAMRLGLRQLQETTFEAARNGLCPLWPFC
jgi:hypothetical protein